MTSRAVLLLCLSFLSPCATGVGEPLKRNEPESVVQLREGDGFASDQIVFFTIEWRREAVLRALERSGRYRDFILAALEEEGLPVELFFLPLVESEYSPTAVSWAGAAGLWQLMPATARGLGLEVSDRVDERFDPVKSTRAALKLLKGLRADCGDWASALAAYNCGTGRLKAVLARKKQFLPRETRLYVPRFVAAVQVGRNPERYGYSPQYEPPMTMPEPRDM